MVSVICLRYLDKAKSPEKMRFTKQAVEGLKHNLSDYVEMGLWKGAVFHLCISAVILVTVRWWGKSQISTIETRLPAMQSVIGRRMFLGLLALIVLFAGSIRLPRMSLSYWGDEGWALSAYVHGDYKPADGKDWQGPIVHKPEPWSSTLWNDENGGNHYFFSVLQRLTMDAWRAIKGLPATAFDEAVSRMPPFVFGLASLALAALLFRWLGRPRAGLLLALMLAVHPWHIRYSTEARGYALMLCLFIAFLWLLLLAARSGRWRWWIGVSVTGFLCVWSWKLAAVSLVAANAVVLMWLLFGRRGGDIPVASWSARTSAVLRLIIANVTAGAFCVALVMPAVLQSPEVTARFQKMGKPMDAAWLKNSFTGVTTGVPWLRASPGNPVEAPLKEALMAKPLITAAGYFGALAWMVFGGAALWRRQRLHGGLCLAVIAASVVGAALFKWKLGVEWIYWYFFPLILPAMVLFAAGIETLLNSICEGGHWRRCGVILIAAIVPLAWMRTLLPFIQLNLVHPYEAQRESFQATRGQHEPWTEKGPHDGSSKVITCHFWRHIDLYDTRALLSVRDVPSLKEQMRIADVSGSELYFTIGMVGFAETTSPDLIVLLRNDEVFEPVVKLWAQEPIHILESYRYKGRAFSLKP